MQKVAAYLIERHDAMNWPEARASEAAQLKLQVEEWLRSKGATEVGPSGVYQAEDGSRATFSIEEAVDGDRTWWMARLEEVTQDFRRFLAAVSITNGSNKVAVYATLEAGSDATLVNPVEVDPRCPKVIRTLLGRPGRWYHGFTELRPLRRLEGFELGQGLAAEIKHPERTVPIIVVTELGQRVALPELAECLAYDLSGLANVVVLNSDATWALTDYLGHALSCYSGAVRLYWPRLSINEDPYRHPLWTESRLRSADRDLIATRKRFQRQLRALLMGASALSVVRPREIDAIRSAASRRAFAELKARATSQEDLAELADLYEKDNDQLRETNADLMARVDELQALAAKLEGDRAALLAHLRAAKIVTDPESSEDIAPDSTIAGDQDLSGPVGGEMRFYKKKFSTPEHDVMVRVNDCGHNRWQPAHAADKARKGVAKAENGPYRLEDNTSLRNLHGWRNVEGTLVRVSCWSSLGNGNMLDRITFDPKIMGGRACLRGMRMTVSLVVNLVANGMTVEEILREYPILEAEDIRQALQYAASLAAEEVYPLAAAS